MRLAVDRDGIRVVKYCGAEWCPVDLAIAPLIRRTMPMLVERAWRR
jgi:hypothetical protein